MSLLAAPPTTAEVGHTSPDEAIDWVAVKAAAQRLVTCATESEFNAAIADASAGDCIIIGDSVGAVSWTNKTISANGTAANRIYITTQNPANKAVTFTNLASTHKDFTITGSYVTIGGFNCLNSIGRSFHLKGANCRVTDVIMTNCGSGSVPVEIDTGAPNFRFDHVLQYQMGANYGIRVRLAANTGGPINGRIDHNTFEGASGNTFAQLGQGTNFGADAVNWTLGCTLENNHVKNLTSRDSNEFPSVKSSGNIIRNNYFQNAQGGIKLRQGNDNLVYSNYLANGNRSGAEFISVNGSRNHVWNNIVELSTAGQTRYAGIVLFAGGTQSNGTYSYAATDCVVENNLVIDTLGGMSNGAVLVGATGAYTINMSPVAGCTIKNNTIIKNGGTKFGWITTAGAPTGCAVTHNVYWGTGADGGGYSEDASPIIGDPLLDATYAPDENSSPALDAGAAVTYALLDYHGVTRSVPPDIGPIEVAPPSPGAEPTLLIYDTFTEAVETELPSHTPDTNTPGNAWVISCGTGRVQVTSSDDKLRVRYAGNYSAAINTGVSRQRLQVDWSPVGGAGEPLIMINREAVTAGGSDDLTTEGACYAAHLDLSADTVRLLKMSSLGVETVLGTTAYALDAAGTYTVTLENDSGELALSIGGIELLTYSDSSPLTTTWCALGMFGGVGTNQGRFDNLSLWELGAVPAEIYKFAIGTSPADGFSFDLVGPDIFEFAPGDSSTAGYAFRVTPGSDYFNGERSNVKLFLIPTITVTLRNE